MKYIAKALLVGLSIVGVGSIGMEDVKAYGCIYIKGYQYPYHHIKNGRIIGEACVRDTSKYDARVRVVDEDGTWYGSWDGEGNVRGDDPRDNAYLLVCMLSECPKRKFCISNFSNYGKLGFCGTGDDFEAFIRNLLH